MEIIKEINRFHFNLIEKYDTIILGEENRNVKKKSYFLIYIWSGIYYNEYNEVVCPSVKNCMDRTGGIYEERL